MRRNAIARIALLFVCAEFAAAADNDHHYTITVDDELATLRIEAHFASPAYRFTARSRRASRYAYDFQFCDRDTPVRMRYQRPVTPAGGIECISYNVDLRAAAKTQRQNRALNDKNLVVSSSLWLWRPALPPGDELLVDFNLPAGVSVSVPWQARDSSGQRFIIRPSPESASAPIAFGRFEQRDIDIPGATLRVSVLQSNRGMNNASILRWIEAAATDVTLTYGRFPNPSPQVLVIPVADTGRSRHSAVPFGRVVRDGGETIELYVNQQKPLSDLLDDWTATHEFSHLMLPYINRQHRWISEGFVQYYQNVLMARAGAYDRQRAWQELYEGLQRGRASRPDLSPNDAASNGTRSSTMKVYWSGAALALMADVALREESGGTQSLDDVLQRLQACCLPSERAWSGPEVFAKLDELAGRDVFMPLFRRYANAVGFPDTAPLFARLGLAVDSGKVRILDRASHAEIRDAITKLDSGAAESRRQLAARVR